MVSTLAQALDLAERFPARQVGVVVDTYHVWWDDRAPAQIAARAGAGPPRTPSSSRTGSRRFPRACCRAGASSGTAASTCGRCGGRGDAAGYTGPIEVELFNEALWARDGAEVLRETAERFVAHVC